MKVCLNADVGESFGRYELGNDAALIPLISAASIACGMHAGDPTVMARTVALARKAGASIGAHPGFNDLWGFGRRQLRMSPREVEHLVTYQIGALQAIAAAQGGRMAHVKPHGALYTMAHGSADLARAIAQAVYAADAGLILIAGSGSELSRAGERAGLAVAHEIYADRTYDDSGALLPRRQPDAVIRDPEVAARRVLEMVHHRAISTVGGKRIPVQAHTICIHGDEATAVATATAINHVFRETGVELSPLEALM